MREVLAHLAVGVRGPIGLELQVGDRRVRFGFDEARRLASDWPGGLGAVAASQASHGDVFAFELGGEQVLLNADEARDLANLPAQLRWLLDLAADISDSCRPPQHERAG